MLQYVSPSIGANEYLDYGLEVESDIQTPDYQGYFVNL